MPGTWSPERIKSLLALHKAGGLSMRAIGERLGVSKQAVIGKLFRFGLCKKGNQRELHAERKRQLVEIWPTGAKAIEIAKLFGCHPRSVGRQAEKLGLPPRERRKAKHKRRRHHVAKRRLVWLNGAIVKRNTIKAEPFEPRPEISIPIEQRRTILTVAPGECRWPIGDPCKLDEFFFCGGGALPGRPYCSHHHSVANQCAAADEVLAA